MTNEQRLKALEMLLNGKSYEDVGKHFCVSKTVIWEMFHGAPWEAIDVNKYCLQYNHYVDAWQIRKIRTVETLGTVYFVSEDIAKRALNEIVIPFENGELEVREIWEE